MLNNIFEFEFELLYIESNRITIEHGILRLRCVQGAPRTSGFAGAEIQRMGVSGYRVARTDSAPHKGTQETLTQTHLAHGPGSLHDKEKDGRQDDSRMKDSDLNHADTGRTQNTQTRFSDANRRNM